MRAGVVAATLFVLVAHARGRSGWWAPSPASVAPRLLDVDGDAHAMRAARASSDARGCGPRGSASSVSAMSEPVRSFTEATTRSR